MPTSDVRAHARRRTRGVREHERRIGLRLYRPRDKRDPLGHYLAFVRDPTDRGDDDLDPDSIYLVNPPQNQIAPILAHETIHMVLDRIGEPRASEQVDELADNAQSLAHPGRVVYAPREGI